MGVSMLKWLFKQFWRQKNKRTISGTGLQYEVLVREKTSEEEMIRRLHLEATQLKSKDINGAVDCLQKAQILLYMIGPGYPISSFLRLPLFLQKAGRYDEAVLEFEILLKKHTMPAERAAIKDKMRLARQREEKLTKR